MERQVYLQEKLENIGINPTEKQLCQLHDYYELVLEKNTVMNLTTITDYKEFVQKHFVDSLIVCRETDLKKIHCMIDVGTGAGFPGIPLKIMYPEIEVVLLDSLNKRVLFLEEVIKKLELNHIVTLHARAEELAVKEQYREQFDLCVARAVANLSTLAEYCLPYVRIGGEFISYKSGNVEEELESARYAIERLGGTVIRIEDFTLPDSDIERSLIHIQKQEPTPSLFPRSAGKPSKEPLSDISKKSV